MTIDSRKAKHRIGNSAGQRHNVYTCDTCGQRWNTIDRDAGTTPMFISCAKFRRGDCHGRAVSAGYPPGAAALTPSHEWYAPDEQEMARMRRKDEPALLEHVKMGGLLLRPIRKGSP